MKAAFIVCTFIIAHAMGGKVNESQAAEENLLKPLKGGIAKPVRNHSLRKLPIEILDVIADYSTLDEVRKLDRVVNRPGYKLEPYQIAKRMRKLWFGSSLGVHPTNIADVLFYVQKHFEAYLLNHAATLLAMSEQPSRPHLATLELPLKSLTRANLMHTAPLLAYIPQGNISVVLNYLDDLYGLTYEPIDYTRPATVPLAATYAGILDPEQFQPLRNRFPEALRLYLTNSLVPLLIRFYISLEDHARFRRLIKYTFGRSSDDLQLLSQVVFWVARMRPELVGEFLSNLDLGVNGQLAKRRVYQCARDSQHLEVLEVLNRVWADEDRESTRVPTCRTTIFVNPLPPMTPESKEVRILLPEALAQELALDPQTPVSLETIL
ncbi:hypothetical protein BJ085DRAFT_36846 [Dimargaris cristalligena]|uniref:F-box domain-containing protein n=1 Tax=Dimargaris cristalligena TaxID=215637 RepID=A0A4P9ZZW7_9FUNG|nr:hypothetical protein BJ085DRAFT_36846 [Dimargaris cristalligena]|eukprot:RKP39267.1 hypothetical protein BJ085DRAFT_36846 [Dimargaris cristalligena]